MPDDPMRAPRVPIENARTQIERYGRENPWVMSTILGLFPPGGINSLLGIDDIEAAMGRQLEDSQYDWAQKRLGIDVARFGDDRSVVFPRQGKVGFMPTVMRHQRTTEIAAVVAAAKARWKSELEIVDNSFQWGQGVIDQLIEAGISPMPVKYEQPVADKRYANLRAQMHFRV